MASSSPPRAASPLLAPGECSPRHVSEDEVNDWLPRCRALPKAELHAHINGCVRDATIKCGPSALRTLHPAAALNAAHYVVAARELAAAQGHAGVSQQAQRLLSLRGERTLADCFALFDVIHALTTRHDVVQRVTREAVQDFADDGVLYLELRTTPKARLLSPQLAL